MRWRRCAPEFPNPLTPAPVPPSARRCPLTFAAVQVAAMVEQHGLSAQQQADRKQQVLSELRARIGDMDDEEFSEFLAQCGIFAGGSDSCRRGRQHGQVRST